MEASQPTWLSNPNPNPISTLISPNCSFRVSFDEASFIEMDPNLTPSKRFLVRPDSDSGFDFPTSQAPSTLVHADKLISNGTLLPMKSHGPSGSVPNSPLYPTIQDNNRLRKSRSMMLRRCNRLPKRIIQKYMDLVQPIWCRLRRGRSDSSRVQGVENWECSSAYGPGPGPRTSGACWVDNRRRSCDSESSIHEAVVHCKRTIGMN
ncbi:unnamed protein product [Lactuca saligna]|uniref:Membrane-associated kinase regulator 6 n=1 Tax=Lactuca saligna TaxID=75948 RepID=A0AA35YHH9_LACSI|nr:unnamed protein product [Lactuca saligna]